MYHLEGTLLTLAYTAFFLFLIGKMKFFRMGSVPVRWFQGAFVLKVLSGFLLYLIYTYYYTDRSTADIWKYYDDAMVMFSALPERPMDYLQMLIGWGADNRERFTAYYDLMSHWDKPYHYGVANDTHLIIRFNAFVRLFSMGHYNVHNVVANFLGLIGLTGIFHFLRRMNPSKERWFFLGVFLMPGMMFWASGVLKEPLLLLGLGLLLLSVLRFSESGNFIKGIMLAGISLWLLLSVKSYALLAIMPGIIGWRISSKWPKFHPALVFGGMYLLLFLGAVALEQVNPEKGVAPRLAKKQIEFYQLAEGGTYVRVASGDTLYIQAEDYDAIHFEADRDDASLLKDVSAVAWQDAKQPNATEKMLPTGTEFYVVLDYGRTGSTIDIPKLDDSIWSIVKASPAALMNALFRPFPWQIDSPFMLLSGLENLIVLLLILLAIILFDRNGLSSPTFYLAVGFAVVILLLTGLVTPVVGAIVRYKVPALPFLVCALIALIKTESLGGFLKRLLPNSIVRLFENRN
ncbi:MAG: hypothetical protein GC178_08720 [Flavobacteriales bacterium]|nr:hypothetical protein [Flavobacteriales bacterium]